MNKISIDLTSPEVTAITVLKSKYKEQNDLVEKLEVEQDKKLIKYLKKNLKTVKQIIKVYETKLIASVWEATIKTQVKKTLIQQVQKDEEIKDESRIPTK